MIGESVGNHRIIAKIGQGGMGTVYEAEDTRLGRRVAIKLLNPSLTSSPRELARFQSEAKVQARLNHPNIVTLHEFEPYHDSYYMVMEYVVGKNVAQIVRSVGALPSHVVVTIAKQVLDGLSAAHALGVVHRDLKPSNIMLTPEGVAKVMDFGIAKVQDIQGLTATGALVGTVCYMSPEQVRGEPVDARSDIYSFGIILFELLTGKVPFKEESDFSIMMHHVKTPPPPPTQILPDIPGALEDIVLRCLEKDPGSRFQSVSEIVAELEGFEEQERAMGRGQYYARRALIQWMAGSADVAPVGPHPPAKPADLVPTVKKEISKTILAQPDIPSGAAPQPATPHSRRRASPLVLTIGLLALVGSGAGYLLLTRGPALLEMWKDSNRQVQDQAEAGQTVKVPREESSAAQPSAEPDRPSPETSASPTEPPASPPLRPNPSPAASVTTSQTANRPSPSLPKTPSAPPPREFKDIDAGSSNTRATPQPEQSQPAAVPIPKAFLIFLDLDQSGERLPLGTAQGRVADILREGGHEVISSSVVSSGVRGALDRGDLAQVRRSGVGYVVMGIAHGSLESQSAYGSTYYVGKVRVSLELVRMVDGSVASRGSANAKSRGMANAEQALADALLRATSDAAREMTRQFQP